ncbi:hypothetical protein, partial [Ornithinicoccus halotolerans]|uniref:hypothetical protein n=1 Tax=Ornithinicoccus halotolerans TaxID=1748220 RepID=UPI001E3C8A6E
PRPRHHPGDGARGLGGRLGQAVVLGAPVRRLVEPLRLAAATGLEQHLGDVDTPEQLARWRERPLG